MVYEAAQPPPPAPPPPPPPPPPAVATIVKIQTEGDERAVPSPNSALYASETTSLDPGHQASGPWGLGSSEMKRSSGDFTFRTHGL